MSTEYNLGTDYINIKATSIIKLKEGFIIYTEDGPVDLNVDITADLADVPSKYHEIFVNTLTAKYLNKVSYVKSLSNQLMERNQYIVQLEAQINKSKPSRSSQSTQPSQPTCEPTQPTCEPFDEDKYQEIDGYELLKYKNNYYLKNIKTNDLYNIKEYQANEVVGKITLKGKIKLN
jgi:hypothetical protein